MSMGPRSSPTKFRSAAAGAVAALFLACAAFAEPGPTSPNWKFDIRRLKNGSVLRGLVLEETSTHVRFQNVRRHPGRATVVFTTLLTRSEIDRCEKLPDDERKLLKARLDELESA